MTNFPYLLPSLGLLLTLTRSELHRLAHGK